MKRSQPSLSNTESGLVTHNMGSFVQFCPIVPGAGVTINFNNMEYINDRE